MVDSGEFWSGTLRPPLTTEGCFAAVAELIREAKRGFAQLAGRAIPTRRRKAVAGRMNNQRVRPAPAAPRDSCNFPATGGVVPLNDVPPVHTPPSGLIPPADFTTFMRNYQDMVFSTAARLTGNDAQAEDISQEVFLKAYENYSHLGTSPTAGGWLKTVATNLSLNHLSRYRNRWRFFSEFKREGEGEGDAPEVEFAAPDTFFAGVEAADRRALVEHALEQLPEHQRVPLVLYHFEDLPYEEIAKKLRVSLAKVKTDILRARAALAKILSRSGTPHEKIFSENP